jgi:hypothetical protein
MIKKDADERNMSLGQGAPDLVPRGVENLPEFKTKNGWVVFDLPPGTPPLTNEKLEEWERADLDEEYRRAVSPRR